MATSVVPALIDAITTNAANALPNVEVFDGMGVSADPGFTYLMIGVDDPDGGNEGYSAYSQQEWANANYTARDEEGDIVCAVVAWNGDADQKACRDEAYETLASIETMLRANPSQGVANVLWTSFGSRIRLAQDQTVQGARAIVIFRIYFRARI